MSESFPSTLPRPPSPAQALFRNLTPERHFHQDILLPYALDGRHPSDTWFLLAESDFRFYQADAERDHQGALREAARALRKTKRKVQQAVRSDGRTAKRFCAAATVSAVSACAGEREARSAGEEFWRLTSGWSRPSKKPTLPESPTGTRGQPCAPAPPPGPAAAISAEAVENAKISCWSGACVTGFMG